MKLPESASIVEYALVYFALGWSIIPIKPRSKRPAVPWKRYQTQRATARTVGKWFELPVHRNVAVICGAVSGGLCVRDFDAVDAYERWAAENPSVAKTIPTVTTARGFHVYFVADPPYDRITHLGDGELRGAGYCLLPPSIHPDGPAYRWLNPIDGALPRLSPNLFVQNELPSVTEEDRRGQRRKEGGQSEINCYLAAFGGETTVRDAVEAAIRATLPKRHGERHHKIFELARILRGIPELAGRTGPELTGFVRRWHSLALPHIRTKPFEETEIDFLQAWVKVRVARGAKMSAIVESAARSPFPEVADEFEQPALKSLVRLCRELQRHHGEHPFFLSCWKAGELIGVDHRTANRWLFLLVARGVLRVVTKGDTKRATRYRYLPEL